MAQNTSFIRWAGGKSWLVPYIQELIEGLEYNNYHESFMGGASVFFAIDIPKKGYLSDVNKELVDTFCAVRDNPQRLIDYLNDFIPDEKNYYEIRASEPRGKYQRAARFLYLNTYSFNGLYRVNRQGKYNVPYGQRQNTTFNYERIFEVSKKLKDVDVICQDFESSKYLIQSGDLVFLDPPYTVSKESNSMFIEYNSKLFSLDDQYRLGELIDYINELGAYYILTNAAHEKILEIFQDKGRLIPRERNSLIGGKKAFRGKVQEYIFTNIPEKGDKDEN
ncbi:MAG: DNA adenine methylase [Firmicutes bacterium]|nr:DNA adenine methylase [Bacillota bacterium]